MSAFLLAILTHTPLWVWALLALIVALGAQQLRTRDIAPQRIVAVPILLCGLSLAGAASAFLAAGSALVLGSWLAGAALGYSSNRVLDLPRRCAANADGSFRVEGSVAPLLLMLCVFMARYVNGIAVAIDPALRTTPGYVVAATLAFALPAGLYVARSRKVWSTRSALSLAGA